MSNFSHLKSLDVQGTATAEMQLHALEGEPTLTLAPALESNKPFFNASLKASRKNMRAIRNGNVTGGLLEETRDEDRRLYAQHIVRGWKGVRNSAGKDVPFSRELCAEFLEALPNWLFDEIREFAGTPANFIGDGGTVDTETVAKNSKPD
ncbi:hypothetical protein ELZ19_06675 [Brucella abortus]|uniref:hypothetical protein n=1 Tax=Brucella abortus TaxID=235 RepID=UPI0004E8C1E1|nr:hypothetical protein [Brucella abortus]KFH18436.1 hypothetical protein IB60_17155 [Brucella abortus LMN1]RUQ67334.1 hypothetical protein ELZ23_15510 [Brucella abortus]RUQ78143.1 hypothetical protein ELZ22_17350 [Brucella abortus]RUQ88279.1 hypothetical protein ELZ18_15570 [Brucella abortus]RUQ90308.1 hypothetical protein ELZ20_15565 [Brucella abortus]